jgi:hypothetical protein
MADSTCSGLIVSKGTKLFMLTDTSATTLQTSLAAAVNPAAILTAYDATGMVWEEIGGVESIGEFGPEAPLGTFTSMKTGVPCKFRGATDYGEIPLTLAKTTLTGITEFIGLQDDAENVVTYFKLQLSNKGATKYQRYYFCGFVRSIKITVGTGDDVVKVNSAIVIRGAIYEGAAV